MHWRGIEPLCPVCQEELYYSTTNAIKDGQSFLESSHQRKKKGNVGALNFGGAIHFNGMLIPKMKVTSRFELETILSAV